MHNQPETIVLLIGHGSQDEDGVAENRRFATLLSERLQAPVQPCFLEFNDPPIAEGLRTCVERGARRVIALPLFLGPGGHQKNDVPALLNWARAQWPHVQFLYGTPLGAQYPLVEVLADRAADAIGCGADDIPPTDTALIVVGRGSRDPDSNSEVSKIARLLWEGREYGAVDVAFHSLTGPPVHEAIARCVRLGARRVVVLPYLLFSGRICRRIAEYAHQAQSEFPELTILVGAPLGDHPGVFEAVAQRFEEAVGGTAAMTCDLCKYRRRLPGFEPEFGLPQSSDHDHGLRGLHHRTNVPMSATRAILPPRYQDNVAVSAAPMGSPPLIYDAEGQVAWDRMWGADEPGSPFCELALAGGPPHRGELLEPVTPEEVRNDSVGYARALAELERGISLTTGLTVMRSSAPGWIGVVCDSDEMALWLMRAIVVENVSVRREGATLFLPVGPAFRLEHELKSVITALAKTHHYWKEHLAALP